MSDPAEPISGVFVVDKPLGPTSMQVCARIRGKLKAGGAPKRIKVGHGGTLDPLATGVLVVLVGPCTRLCDRVMAGVKAYTARVDLSVTTATDDAESERLPVAGATDPGEQAVRSACERFVGEVMQTPPVYSAMKVGGTRAYALARAGKRPTLEPRPVRIDACELVTYAWPEATIAVRCGKGTYIRSLGRDIGATMGLGGSLLALRRTAVGPFALDSAVTYDDMPAVMTAADLRDPAEFGLG